ncbi:hypothetical protein AJ80_05903 [Polytolypa hystricis UAMH7299]|uniref:Uncharacterized protein n=1 Tax=Polytolypa hystricis (strain UAMH7299) TaxID=1447883 RepID=A0A2B7Y0Y2_POLH7|nr:hypothetical protein AJ80_05903 [Polytolypa hystricis UAMH7299]
MERGVEVPFTSNTQLCHDLKIEKHDGTHRLAPADHYKKKTLPGQPFISLSNAEEMVSYLESEMLTPRLNKLSPHLWLVATQRSSHIPTLHNQIVRGRNIIITENPELHLVWFENRVFIKPIPQYLLSRAFWEYLIHQSPSGSKDSVEDESSSERRRRTQIARAALGYLRSYYYLIRHESDFQIAKDARLLPAKVRWSSFADFSSAFGHLEDTQVSARYRFGELRLSRLNFWAKVFLGHWQFQKVTWQYSSYFNRFFGLILFVFGALSVVLSAMQVGVSADPSWSAFMSVSAWFSVVTLLVVLAIVSLLMLALVAMLARELVFALKDKIRR